MKYIYNYILFEKKQLREDTHILTEKETIKILKTKCKKFDPSNGYVTRAVNSLKLVGQFFLIDPKKIERVSRDNPNVYTVIMDNNIRWKGYPKRKNSLICTYENNFPSFFKNDFIVIPFDNANFGVCSSSDIWHDWKDILTNNDINISVEELLKRLEWIHTILLKKKDIKTAEYFDHDYHQNIKFSNNYNELEKEIRMLGNYIVNNLEDIKKSQLCSYSYKWFIPIYNIAKNYGLWEFFTEELFVPYSFNRFGNRVGQFKKLTAHNLFKYKLRDEYEIEVWTDSECLLINKYKFIDLNNKYNLGYKITSNY